MKKTGIVLGAIIAIILFIISCDKLKSDHPQASIEMPGEKTLSATDIQAYADSVNLLLPQLEKQESLVYSLRDYSFQVAKYTENGKPLLFVEKGRNGESGIIEKMFYIKDGKLLLYSEMNKTTHSNSEPITLTNIYFRNNIAFYAEQKKASSEATLKTAAFKKAEPQHKELYSDLKHMEDALKQKGKFDLVFDGITEYPKARYLIMSKNEYNAYRAVIRVIKTDDFIRELSSNPSRYTGSKLDIDWTTNNDDEMVYVNGRIKRD
ncbi:hypothetical protein BDE36_4782 [Arcticibacter tournemirensis]|uniref:Uncharacterized protein n=1 Tax=Arcticibacter tournemirensis TaxID=699437 RepID=A0A5M9HCS8_9SPHI|nr:hypothetical protein [Arcticibacter tournemirensis]KAA8484683.1 hypothetical protein F1649_05780 [Arcticibacter tournemirensis]TQM47023.1 hypothetical protein BDE36_4782 [Arcticibacter tournemirensis]